LKTKKNEMDHFEKTGIYTPSAHPLHKYLYTKPLVPRDKQTPLWVQKGYVWLTFVVFLLSVVSLGGGYYTSQNCSGFPNDGAKNVAEATSVVFYIMIGPLIIWTLLSFVFAVKWRWLWMTNTIAPAPQYGEDVEDFTPGILARDGTKLYVHSTALDSDIEMRIDSTYDDLLNQKIHQNQ